MDENDDIGSKILSNFDDAFQRDELIDEFGIVPILENVSNRNPVQLMDHKLGLEAWAVSPVYMYAHKSLMALRAKKTHQNPTRVNSLSRAILLITADHTTAWNMRKKLLLDGVLDLRREDQLSKIILSKHPKSSETFSHRKWLMVSLPTPKDAVQNELKVCLMAAEKYSNNYYAWSHRIWLLRTFFSQNEEVLRAELKSSFASSHVSDHSGFHYRQQIFLCLSKLLEPSSFMDALQDEENFIADLIFSYSGHEALWSHRKYIVWHKNVIANQSSEPTSAKRSRQCDSASTLMYEQKFCDKVLSSCDSLWQQTLVDKYLQWLKRTLS